MLPVMTPVAEIVSPVGAPVSAYVHGPFRQDLLSVRLTAPPMVFVWLAGVVMVGLATIVQVNAVLVAVARLASVIVTETVDVPTVVGEPLMRPALLTVRPGGALVSAKVHGVFGQDEVSCTDTVEVTVSVWAPGEVTDGAATIFQLNVAVAV